VCFWQACNTDEPFPTTLDDIAGFWDMVYLQVGHVDCLFEELNELRNKGWPAEVIYLPSNFTAMSLMCHNIFATWSFYILIF
jgi:hypothetical protein